MILVARDEQFHHKGKGPQRGSRRGGQSARSVQPVERNTADILSAGRPILQGLLVAGGVFIRSLIGLLLLSVGCVAVLRPLRVYPRQEILNGRAEIPIRAAWVQRGDIFHCADDAPHASLA